MPKSTPKPVIVTATWTKPVQPGQIEALRAALFAPTIRRAAQR